MNSSGTISAAFPCITNVLQRRATMKPFVSDELWQRLQPLLPPPPPRRFRFPGRKPLDYRKILTGILFVLKTGMAWEDLPAELGCGCGKTCRDYLKRWSHAGVWHRLHQLLLTEWDDAGQIDWSRAAVDAAFAKAPLGGEDTGPNPTDRGKSGSKHHVLVEGHGIPLAATTTAANVPEVKRVIPLVVEIPPVGEDPQAKQPERMYADRGYDSQPHRDLLRWLGIEPLFARRRTEHGSGLGVYRWVVERTLSWIHSMGRMRRRLSRSTEIHDALLRLTCGLICLTFL
jgi:transposase